jgi:hypothetical protein
VRRGLVSAIALLALAPSATAAHSTVRVDATPTEGVAPLAVTFAADSPASWDFGDGTFGSGQKVEHTYAAGRWIAQWTSGTETGTIVITAHGIELTGPARVRFRHRVTFRGQLIPAEAGVGVQVSSDATTLQTTSKADGTFAVRTRIANGGPWTAATSVVTSRPLDVAVIPQLRTGLLGNGARGSRLVFAASVRPRDAGQIAVRIQRNGEFLVDRTYYGAVRIRLDTRRLTTYVIHVQVQPNAGFTSAAHMLRAHIVLPRLGFGAHGVTVAQLGSRLRTLHYATPFTATFDSRLLDSVYAFEKVQGLAPYPASHGCVRVPMWIAPYLYATNPYGETVYVY